MDDDAVRHARYRRGEVTDAVETSIDNYASFQEHKEDAEIERSDEERFASFTELKERIKKQYYVKL